MNVYFEDLEMYRIWMFKYVEMYWEVYTWRCILEDGPLVLAPADAVFVLFFLFFFFVCLYFCLFVLLSFCLFYFCLFVIIKGSISTTTPIFCSNPNFFSILPQTTTTIATHPPQQFMYLRETQANVLRGLQRFWGGGIDLATISEEQEYCQFGF